MGHEFENCKIENKENSNFLQQCNYNSQKSKISNDNDEVNLSSNVVDFYGGKPFKPVWSHRKDGKLKSSNYRTLRKVLRRSVRQTYNLRELAKLIIPRMSPTALCSWTLKTDNPSSFRELLCRAIDAHWIAMNSTNVINAIAVDCDHDEYEIVASRISQGMLKPTYTAINAQNGHFQVVWMLAVPIFIQSQKQAAKLYKVARRLLNLALDGDPCFDLPRLFHPAEGRVLSKVTPCGAV